MPVRQPARRRSNAPLRRGDRIHKYRVEKLIGSGGFAQVYKAYDTVENVAVPLVAGPFVQQFPALSPDGRWLAFCSGESGRQEVYVQPFPEGTGRWMVSTDGGTRPIWTKEGRELVFFDEEADDVYAVAVTLGDSPAFGAPERMFMSPIRTGTGNLATMTRDGERFLAAERPLVDRSEQSASLIQNWTRILER